MPMNPEVYPIALVLVFAITATSAPSGAAPGGRCGNQEPFP